MSQVIVQINGRNYTMQCDDGQEDHLRELARMIDGEITNIRNAIGQLGDIRLLIMASLVIADRLTEASRRAETLEEQLQDLRASRNRATGQSRAMEEAVTQTLDAATLRLEALAHMAPTSSDPLERPRRDDAPPES